MYWAADATQFFTEKFARGQFVFYSISLPGGVPHSLGDTIPSPGGQYSSTFSGNHAEIRRARDGKIYSLNRKDAPRGSIAWSPHDKRLAIVFHPPGLSVPDRTEVLDAESGRWTTGASVLGITGVAWLSEDELVYVQDEHAPRRDSNFWVVHLNSSTGIPSGAAHRLTQWIDYSMQQLKASADGLPTEPVC